MILSIVIPVFNEKKTILQILKKIDDLDSKLNRELIIVDDGSTDGTRDILDTLRSRKDIKVIFKEKNSGKGDSLKIGFKESKGDYVIVQDADLEYEPKDYFLLLDKITDSSKTVVYGSRFMGKYKDMSYQDAIQDKGFPSYYAWATGTATFHFKKNLEDVFRYYSVVRQLHTQCP